MTAAAPICDKHMRLKIMATDGGYCFLECPDCRAEEDAVRDKFMSAHPAGEQTEEKSHD